MRFIVKVVWFIYYFFKDKKAFNQEIKDGNQKFTEYGMTLFTGHQGGGKTMSLVIELERYRAKYPKIYIATNFGYKYENESLRRIDDILDVVQRVKADPNYIGLVIGWDEIQNDFDNGTRTFPVSLLRTITQQRKQGIKMLATSQVFTRVAKAIREQTYSVVECKTLLFRWTFQRWYDAEEYEYNINNPMQRKKMFAKKKFSFIQHNDLRNLYDSYAVIDALTDLKVLDDNNLKKIQNQ